MGSVRIDATSDCSGNCGKRCSPLTCGGNQLPFRDTPPLPPHVRGRVFGGVRPVSQTRFENHFASKSERGSPDCLMIPNNVPIFSSLWSGTGTVVVESSSFFCMMIWLPFRRTSTKPCLDRILQTSRPERMRRLGTSLPRGCLELDRWHSWHDGHDVGLFLQPAPNL